MKATKWIVGVGAVMGIAACFMDWATIELTGLAKAVSSGSDFPAAGMDQGGPIFIFLLAMPLIAALVGVLKRMGRGMGVLALIGGSLSSLLALVKYADIADAGAKLAEADMGSVGVAGGYWLLFVGSAIAAMGGLIALIKPEPKPVAAAPAQPAYPMAS